MFDSSSKPKAQNLQHTIEHGLCENHFKHMPVYCAWQPPGEDGWLWSAMGIT
jgi:hypothetical protein